MEEGAGAAFGLDAIELDDRMRLFSYASSPDRAAYRWILLAMESARTGYQVVLSNKEVAAALLQLCERHPECPDPAELDLLVKLDQLHDWKVLDRTEDATRAASLAEYRNRHSVYCFTEAGWIAHQAVERVIHARVGEEGLSRTVFRELLADLEALAAANASGDSIEVYSRFNRLDKALADIVDRAARFYTMLADLARTQEASPQIFLSHKDALLTHLRDFHTELQLYSPLLAEAVMKVEQTGPYQLIQHAADADDRLFTSMGERLEDWNHRWEGLKSWLAPSSVGGRSEAGRLADATVTAIGDITSMLRRLTEATRGGVSRESQLRHLAAWLNAAPTERAAHALFDAVFGLGGPRHLSVAHEDHEAISTAKSWWDAPAVELSRTLTEKGREPGSRNGNAGKLQRNDAERRRLRERQLTDNARRTAAAAELVEQTRDGFAGPVLTEAQTALLLRLLDAALASRNGPLNHPISATAHGIRLRLEPDLGGRTTVACKSGSLHLDGVRLTITAGGRR
ncbi:TIGR02677 family protein [Glycomyces buryatensis]|uniref:TIGR02677 family protein n=1 Tax=Glycomyces buryatensis TaxID=2570927 RepID=A0A4S8QKA1_9ACTN|nr:TIGR02677 family protein [Glycomyces buryatensis]THV41174.1 TIGR02677 family protein [Glycomyces buryatensis]